MTECDYYINKDPADKCHNIATHMYSNTEYPFRHCRCEEHLGLLGYDPNVTCDKIYNNGARCLNHIYKDRLFKGQSVCEEHLEQCTTCNNKKTIVVYFFHKITMEKLAFGYWCGVCKFGPPKLNLFMITCPICNDCFVFITPRTEIPEHGCGMINIKEPDIN